MTEGPSNRNSLRRGAIRVARKLRRAGFEAFLVGGCVRDHLLGRRIKDYDIATDARPKQVRRLFPRTIAVGAQFGVIVVVAREGEYEVATFRADATYSDGRRPDSIRFATAREDVLRRDFTINGLLQDPETGTLEDFVGGQADIKGRVIRAIRDPRERFTEDHLRMLRAIRFAATLGFDIEANTFGAIVEMAPLVASVANERVHSELSRAFQEGSPARAYTLLLLTGVLEVVLPEVGDPHPTAAATLQALGPAPLPLILAALLGDAPEEKGVALATRLRSSRVDRELLAYLLRTRRMVHAELTRADSIRLVREPDFEALARLVRAELLASGRPLEPLDALLELRATLSERQRNPGRLLTGSDLMAMGLKPGPAFKALLTALEDAQLEARVTTRDEAEALVRELTSGDEDEDEDED